MSVGQLLAKAMAAANRYRPRAPSPKRNGGSNTGIGQHDFDSDNTYSLVQDSMRDRKMTQVARIDRMFGDSANEDNDHDKKPNLHLGNNKFGSVSSNSTNSSSLHGKILDVFISVWFSPIRLRTELSEFWPFF